MFLPFTRRADTRRAATGALALAGWAECNEAQHRCALMLGFALLNPAYAVVVAQVTFGSKAFHHGYTRIGTDQKPHPR
jgi:hypothetical protein